MAFLLLTRRFSSSHSTIRFYVHNMHAGVGLLDACAEWARKGTYDRLVTHSEKFVPIFKLTTEGLQRVERRLSNPILTATQTPPIADIEVPVSRGSPTTFAVLGDSAGGAGSDCLNQTDSSVEH